MILKKSLKIWPLLYFMFLFLLNFSIHDTFSPQEIPANHEPLSGNKGRLIFAYKGFEKFLNTEHTWVNYEKYVLEPYPAIRKLHKIYKLVDIEELRQEISVIPADSFRNFLKQVSDEQLQAIYDSVVTQSKEVLKPLADIDICFFLSLIPGCMNFPVSGRQTVLISVSYNLDLIPLILAHEYAHCLHRQRSPQMSSTLKSRIISEGVACYFPRLVFDSTTIYDGLWMMSKQDIDWCISNEKLIRDTMFLDLDKGDQETLKKYYIQGSHSNPPKGFPEKTSYFVGYRVIANCLKKMSLQELCTLDAQTIIDNSGFFK